MRRSINGYSGPVAYGDESVPPPRGAQGALHLERAYWLTGQVETGNRMGSVMMGDGTGFTIGRDQHVAVYPRELADEDYDAEDDQGGAWALLAAIELDHGPVSELWHALEAHCWYVAKNGSLRWLGSGKAKVGDRLIEHRGGSLVHGALIREVFTPREGKVPRSGSKEWRQARGWAVMLHNLTAHKSTWQTQHDFGLNHLYQRVQSRRVRLSPHRRRTTLQKAIYGQVPAPLIRSADMNPAVDLALCVLHSYTVNAPSITHRLLVQALTETGWTPGVGNGVNFARTLLKKIKETKYGFWSRRWDRTRQEAMKAGWNGGMGWWDAGLFQGPSSVMPRG